MDINKIMGKVCNGCSKPAVADLIFGEMAEQARVPWCAHCIVPHTWDGYPYRHAETYSQDWEVDNKEPQCTKCGELGRNVWRGKGYCAECFNIVSGMNKIEKKSPLCPSCHSMQGTCGHNEENTVGFNEPIIKATQEALSAAFKEQDTQALYSRQPHYKGGIDPITFGKDNLSPSEMNGFYKMNVIKYVARCDRKNGLEDLQKARDYLNLLIADYEKHPVPCEPEEEGLENLGEEEYGVLTWDEYTLLDKTYDELIKTGIVKLPYEYPDYLEQALVTRLERNDIKFDSTVREDQGVDYYLTEDTEETRDFKDCIIELHTNKSVTLPKITNNCFIEAMEHYVEEKGYVYSVVETADAVQFKLI